MCQHLYSHICFLLISLTIFFMTTDHSFQPQYGDADISIIPQNEMCKSDRMNVFIGVIYAYKGLLLVSGLNEDDDGDDYR